MRHFGTIVFGCLTAVAILGVLWLSHGAGTNDGHAAVFGLTPADRLLLADHSHHAMIDYPYGAV